MGAGQARHRGYQVHSAARLYTLGGGAEWFVTVLVERLLELVYSTDLDRGEDTNKEALMVMER